MEITDQAAIDKTAVDAITDRLMVVPAAVAAERWSERIVRRLPSRRPLGPAVETSDLGFILTITNQIIIINSDHKTILYIYNLILTHTRKKLTAACTVFYARVMLKIINFSLVKTWAAAALISSQIQLGIALPFYWQRKKIVRKML